MRPDRITELLEANNREVERRRAVVHAARKLRNTLAASADVLECFANEVPSPRCAERARVCADAIRQQIEEARMAVPELRL